MSRKCRRVRKPNGAWKECTKTSIGIHKKSYRWKIVSRRVRLLFGCPKGKWRKGRCKIGMKLIKTLKKI